MQDRDPDPIHQPPRRLRRNLEQSFDKIKTVKGRNIKRALRKVWRFFQLFIGSIIFFIGIILFILPIPIGIFVMGLGLIITCLNPLGRIFLKVLRRKHPKLDHLFDKASHKSPKKLKHLLDKTRPNPTKHLPPLDD